MSSYEKKTGYTKRGYYDRRHKKGTPQPGYHPWLGGTGKPLKAVAGLEAHEWLSVPGTGICGSCNFTRLHTIHGGPGEPPACEGRKDFSPPQYSRATSGEDDE